LNYFTENFKITDETYSELLKMATTEKIIFTKSEKIKSKKRISQRLKEEIASGIWDDKGRIYVNSKSNRDLIKVLTQ
jgi:hypothetical protein